jgi:hypothetical protein
MLPALHHPAERLALNFVRRYKWAFRPEYEKLRPQVAIPDLSSFASASVEILKHKREPVRLHFERARDGLAKLDGSLAGFAGPWHEYRLRVCVPGFPGSTYHMDTFSRLPDPSLPLQVN